MLKKLKVWNQVNYLINLHHKNNTKMNKIEIIRTEENAEERTYSIGQMFLNKLNDDLFLLTSSGHFQVILANVKTGARYEAVGIKDFGRITIEELNRFTSDFLSKFTPVDTTITVTLWESYIGF